MAEMESRNTKAVVRRSTETNLMAPLPKRVKRPKNVIDEESYTHALSDIIARDFFPGLLEMETQQEYLDALESQNAAWIASASRRLKQLMIPARGYGQRGISVQAPLRAYDTPRKYVDDTPSSATREETKDVPHSRLRRIDTSLSLDRFQAKYTSEDNESFYRLLDTQNEKRAKRYAWMWSANNQMPSRMMLKQKEVEARLLQSRHALHDDGGEKDCLAIKDIVEKPTRPDAWTSKPANELMFAPSGVEDSIESLAQRAQNRSRAGPKSVVYANTRISDLGITAEESSIPSSPSISAVRNAITGKRSRKHPDSDLAGSETPRVNGYAFVDDEPQEGVQRDPVKLIFDFDACDSTINPFIIKAQSRREDLHHRLVDTQARSKRESTKNGFTGGVSLKQTPRFTSSPKVEAGGLTPAAQRLLSRVGVSSIPSAFETTGIRTPKARTEQRSQPSGNYSSSAPI